MHRPACAWALPETANEVHDHRAMLEDEIMYRKIECSDTDEWIELTIEKSIYGYAKIRIVLHSPDKHDDLEVLVMDGGEYCPDYTDELSEVLAELSSKGVDKNTIQLCHESTEEI